MACDFLILGGNGQVGWELQRAVSPLGSIVACTRQECDLNDIDQLRSVIRHHGPSILINAAAYTAVDQAESEKALAHKINGEAVAAIAEEAHRLGSLLVHYSTDYVFDGEKPEPYNEDDQPRPQSVYGSSKRAGEEAIERSGAQHFIFRTSWVFSVLGANFAKTILRLAKERDSLNIISDQFGAPTSAELIADATAACLQRWRSQETDKSALSGLYHLTANGDTSWFGYAQELVKTSLEHNILLNITPDAVHPISTTEYPLPATRPANSRLSLEKLKSTFGLSLPSWQHGVHRFVTEIANQED